MYNAARLEAGRKFRENKALRAQDPEAEVKLAEAQEIARILRENVVQGEATEGKSHYRTFTFVSCNKTLHTLHNICSGLRLLTISKLQDFGCMMRQNVAITSQSK